MAYGSDRHGRDVSSPVACDPLDATVDDGAIGVLSVWSYARVAFYHQTVDPLALDSFAQCA